MFFPALAWQPSEGYLVKLGPFGLNGQRLLAIAVLALLTWVNSRGIRSGAVVQNIFTVAKTGALVALVGLGVFAGRNPEAVSSNFINFWRDAGWNFDAVRLVGVAMVGALFSADAWNNVTFTAGEVRKPRRDVPLALGLGVGVVCALYIAVNFVYLKLLPLTAIQAAPEDRVATAAAGVIFGPVAVQLMAAAVMISTFGCINGMVLAGARVYYAMAIDKLFFRPVARVHPRFHTPAVSLVVQCVWACLLTVSGTYSDLLDYVIFAVLLFYILTIAGIFVLRRKRPELERPYPALGYPWLPALYILAAGVIEGLLLFYKPRYTWPGLIIVLLGVPGLAQRRHQFRARGRRAPVLLDVLHHQRRALVVAHLRRVLRVVHRVGKIAHQDAADAPARHLLDGERAVQHAHIRVHPHHEQVPDAAVLEEAVNLPAIVGDDVVLADRQPRMLPRPDINHLVPFGVAAAVAVIDRQLRIGQRHRRRRLHLRQLQHALPLRVVLVKLHHVRRRVNDADARRPRLVHHRRHPPHHLVDTSARAPAPVLVPHVADQDRHPGERHFPDQPHFLPHARLLERLDPAAQRQPDPAPASGRP